MVFTPASKKYELKDLLIAYKADEDAEVYQCSSMTAYEGQKLLLIPSDVSVPIFNTSMFKCVLKGDAKCERCSLHHKGIAHRRVYQTGIADLF